MRKINLSPEQANAIEKIATKSKMDDWFRIHDDENTWAYEKDINDLIDGATEYDISNLNSKETLDVMSVLIHCHPIK